MKRKPASIAQHIMAARHINDAHESIANAMRALGVLDYEIALASAIRLENTTKPASVIGQIKAADTDALLAAHRALDKLRLKLAVRVDADHGQLDPFIDGHDIYRRTR